MAYNPLKIWYEATWNGDDHTRVKREPLGEKFTVKKGETVKVDGDMAEHLRTERLWDVSEQPCEAPKDYQPPKEQKTENSKNTGKKSGGKSSK